MPSPIISPSSKISKDDEWATAPEEEPLLEGSKAAAIEQHSISSPRTVGVDFAPALPGTAPIQLPPDIDLSAEYPLHTNNQPIDNSIPFRVASQARSWMGSLNMSPDNKTVLGYVGRGCLIVLITPLAFLGMALYTVGAVLEGVAMVMKGVGALGGNLMMHRKTGQQSPVIQSTVNWV